MTAVLPDVEKLVRDWLLTRTAVTTICSTRISRSMRSTPTYPCLTLHRIGGTPPVRRWLDEARIELQAWAEDAETASLLARTTRAALHDLEGQTLDGGTVTGIDDDLPITWLPDDSRDPTVPRFAFGVLVYAHP